MVKVNKYDYPEDCMETIKINKRIRDDVAALFKQKNLNKSKLIEEFYKTILLKFKDGTLNLSSGYITINIFSMIGRKTKKKSHSIPLTDTSP